MEERLLAKWGSNIAWLRERHGLTQKQLGDLMDPPVTQPTVARWEKGKIEPRLTYKLQLCRVLHTDAGLLFPMVTAA